MIETTWNPLTDQPVTFTGNPLDIPLDAISLDRTTSAIVAIDAGGALETPVWLFPRAARDLEKANLAYHVGEATFGSLRVLLYFAAA